MPGVVVVNQPGVVLYDASGNEMYVEDGVAIPANTKGILQAGKDGSGDARYILTDTSGRPQQDIARWFGSAAPTVGQKVMAESIPVTHASDQPPIQVTLGNPDAVAICIGHDDKLAIGGDQAFYFYNAANYTVPVGYKLTIGQFNAYAEDDRTTARVGKLTALGTWNPNTGVYTNSTSYTAPLFGSFLELEVTTAMGNVDDQVITISYTNESGVSGRTATAVEDKKLKKQTPVGYKLDFHLQEGDLGVRSVQSVTADKPNTGAVTVNGGIDIWRMRMGTADESYTTVPAAGALAIAGETIAIDFSITGAATERRVIKCIGILEEDV